MSDLVQTWKMSSEANLFLLDAIDEDYLGDRYASRVRTVAAQFAHMHNVRCRWLSASAPDLAAEVAVFPRGAELTKSDLIDALNKSSVVVEKFLEECEASGNVPSWKGPPASFLGYLIAHEAHHRGLAMAALRVSGHKMPEEVVYGLWDWGKPSRRADS